MTTRKKSPRRRLAALLSALALGAGGCSTPGPLHLYAAAPGTPALLCDLGGEAPADVPSCLEPDETLTGLAYDPFTDHLFLRLAPGNRIRVVDRPARAIKREFAAEGTPATGGGDLAVRPRDGHLFLVHPSEAALIELTRFGKFVRKISLEKLTCAPSGVAYDTVRDQLLLLEDGNFPAITVHDLAGRQTGSISLAHRAGPPLAFDSGLREFYAPVDANDPKIAVFSATGKFLRFVPQPAEFLDVGPRSFLRLF